MSENGWKYLLFGCCVIGVGLRLFIIAQPAEEILSRFGSDDLFYFTEVAKNVRLGNGLTFDSIHPTTGVQPLWLLVLLPFGQFFEDPSAALKIVLALATLFSLATALLFPVFLERTLGNKGFKIGIIASCIWMLHPKIMQVSFEATEASLAAFAWVCSALIWLKSTKSNSSYLLGLVLGFGILARVDHLVLAFMFWLFPFSDAKNLARKTLQMFPGIALTFGGWLLISWKTTASISMDSGAIKRLHYSRWLELEALNLHEQITHQLTSAVYSLKPLFQADASVSFTILILGFLIVVVTSFRSLIQGNTLKEIFPRTTEVLTVLAPLFTGAMFVFLAYAIILPHQRAWYLIPLLVSATVILSLVLFDLFSEKSNKLNIIISSTVLFGLHFEAFTKARKGVDASFFEAINYVQENVPEGSKIGAFNSGMAGAWLSPENKTINLDGVVNHSIRKALQDKTLNSYVIDNDIEFILDNEGSIDFFSTIGGDSLKNSLVLVKEFPNKNAVHQLGLWRVRKTNREDG